MADILELARSIKTNAKIKLHEDGKYDDLMKQVMEMKLSMQIFDVFGEELQSDNLTDFFATSETDLDRQLRVADSKMGGCGFHLAYGRKYIDFDNPNAFKVDCILFAFDSECIAQLNSYAEKKFHELNDEYRKYITVKSEKCRQQYSNIIRDGDEISKHNFTLPETISAKIETGGTEFYDHLFANAVGIAKIKLNGWEQAVIEEEQKRPDYVCWLRNPPRQSWDFVEDEIDEDGFNEYDDEETAEKKQAIQSELKIVRHSLYFKGMFRYSYSYKHDCRWYGC